MSVFICGSTYNDNINSTNDSKLRKIDLCIPIDTSFNIELVEPELELNKSENIVDSSTFRPYNLAPDDSFTEFPLDDDLQNYIYKLCDKYGISYSLVISVIWRESTFNPDAYSHGWKGLMQINESAQSERIKNLNVDNIYNPYQNVLVGIDYLVYLFQTHGENVHYVLMAYNGGESYADRLYSKGIYSTKYSRWIVDKAYQLTEIYGY